MMRTAKILSYFAYGIVVVGIGCAFSLFPVLSLKFFIAVVASLLAGVVLRLLAIIGQLVYELRNDTGRALNSMERSLFQSNALAQEIRDLLDEARSRKNG